MIKRSIATLSGLALSVAVLTQSALAQRPPSGNQGPPQMSVERAWAWLMARPGVIVAIGICIVAILYLVITKRKSST